MQENCFKKGKSNPSFYYLGISMAGDVIKSVFSSPVFKPSRSGKFENKNCFPPRKKLSSL